MSLNELVKSKREDILRIASKHGARNVRVFGSAARGDSNDKSDIDFLVEMGSKPSPFFPGGLLLDLEELLGRPSTWSPRKVCTGIFVIEL